MNHLYHSMIPGCIDEDRTRRDIYIEHECPVDDGGAIEPKSPGHAKLLCSTNFPDWSNPKMQMASGTLNSPLPLHPITVILPRAVGNCVIEVDRGCFARSFASRRGRSSSTTQYLKCSPLPFLLPSSINLGSSPDFLSSPWLTALLRTCDLYTLSKLMAPSFWSIETYTDH